MATISTKWQKKSTIKYKEMIKNRNLEEFFNGDNRTDTSDDEANRNDG